MNNSLLWESNMLHITTYIQFICFKEITAVNNTEVTHDHVIDPSVSNCLFTGHVQYKLCTKITGYRSLTKLQAGAEIY